MMQVFCHIRLRWYFGIRCLAQGHVAYRGQGLNHWPLYDWRSTWATAALLYRPWNSSYPKGAWFITWFFCLVTWIEAQGWIRIPLQNTPVFLVCHLGYGGQRTALLCNGDTFKNAKVQRNPGDWRLLPAITHIRSNHISSTSSCSECLTSLAVTEIGAAPK